ncbi:MAG: amidohydrolase [Salinarimonas sp.]|nr:amidohydrolase [Salinarimonas sp.]
MQIAADIVLTNGRVWRGLGHGFAQAIALWGGKVLASGSDEEIADLIGPKTEVIDLAGRLATPGLNDAHMHLLPYGAAMAEVDLRPRAAPTLAALLDALRERARTTPPGEWVIGRGYDHFRLDTGRHPTRDELDAALPDHPVWTVRTDGHLAVANSMALTRAGIDEDTPSPPGGLIERREGRLTGLLAETAREPVLAVLPRTDIDEMVSCIERGGRDLMAHGITSCMEAAVGIRDGWLEMQAYQKAHRENRLPLRVYACLMGDVTRNVLPEAMAAGMCTGGGDARLRIGPVKIFTDGSAGGRTAAMTKPYLGGGPEDTGLLCLPAEQLTRMVNDAHRAGWQMAIHAIGDAAIDQVLDAYEAALTAMPDPQRRHRIEHCGWLRPDQMARMQNLHILPAPQPAFMYWFGDLYLTLAERERVEASHPMRTWIEQGLEPSASTDCPVVEIDPFANLYTMITRKTEAGTLLGPDQALTLEEALHAYTFAGAYAAREEAIKGQLLPGRLADIAVFDRDLFAVSPEAIRAAACDITILDGDIVHRREAPVA